MHRRNTTTTSQGSANGAPASSHYFAPGAVEGGPPRRSWARRSWARRILGTLTEALILLAIAAAVGIASGWVQTKGLL